MYHLSTNPENFERYFPMPRLPVDNILRYMHYADRFGEPDSALPGPLLRGKAI